MRAYGPLLLVVSWVVVAKVRGGKFEILAAGNGRKSSAARRQPPQNVVPLPVRGPSAVLLSLASPVGRLLHRLFPAP